LLLVTHDRRLLHTVELTRWVEFAPVTVTDRGLQEVR
jgi:hypothetical protein